MNQPASDAAVNVVWYGSEQPEPERRVVRAGPFTAVLEGADLRYVRLNGELVILRLYAAIRDQSWGTIAPVFTSYELEEGERSFSLTFTAEHVSTGEQGVDFAWQGRISGSEDGVIVCEMDGAARTAFWRNRIGWCVLHPMELAGEPVHIRTGDQVVESRFPELISPHQPFFNIEEMTHRTARGDEISIAFAGDVFETEDQRNWTDASYKTYSTPLELPYPVRLEAGERVKQSVTLTARVDQVIEPAESDQGTLMVQIGDALDQTLPPIGVSTAGHGKPLTDHDFDLFRPLNLGHLHHVVDLTDESWRQRLDQAAREAAEFGCPLGLEVVAGDDGELNALFEAIQGLPAPVVRVAVYPDGGYTSTDEVLAAARAARDATGSTIPIGGGSRAYFTQLNRAVPSPALLDFVTYAINPQVHAFDNASLVETLATQPITVESARAITDGRPVVVGPNTFLPRLNPDAVPSSEPRPEGALPPTVDVRQSSLFGAGWTLGSIRRLAESGVDALTYFETNGWRGLIERSDHPLMVSEFHSRPGIAFPVYHVFADVGEFAGGTLLDVALSDFLAIEALALRKGEHVRVLLASFRNQEETVRIALPGVSDLRVRVLDDQSYDLAADDPARFRQTGTPILATDGQIEIQLRPYAVVTIDGRISGG